MFCLVIWFQVIAASTTSSGEKRHEILSYLDSGGIHLNSLDVNIIIIIINYYYYYYFKDSVNNWLQQASRCERDCVSLCKFTDYYWNRYVVSSESPVMSVARLPSSYRSAQLPHGVRFLLSQWPLACVLKR